MTKQKTYFISHGSPTLPLDDVPARDFLKELGQKIPRPDAILMISAHWETEFPTLNAVNANETIHDFGGFPPALYELLYPAKGSPELANQIKSLLDKNGLKAQTDSKRGLDHGAWVPLLLMYPDADIPVLQLSIQSHNSPEYHYNLGKALAPLRDSNIAIIASGSFTHNLGALNWRGGEESYWSKEFATWFHNALISNNKTDLFNYRKLAPYATMNHPTDEHLLPIYVAFGAAGESPHIERIHSSATLGSLRMDAYSFN